LLKAKARWEVARTDGEEAARLAEELQIHPLLARLLAVRGMSDPLLAKAFLQGGEDAFHDPFLLLGMREAVGRIRLALERREKIRIYGDYDADGVSSTTLMIFLMRRLGASFDYYIPHRVREGYGLNVSALEQAKRDGISLIVTVDTGISAVSEIEYANAIGIDIVVTDHHEPPEALPPALALVNPKQPGCPYPFKGLAGVGVAFKLAHALLGEPPLDFAEIAAIGTVADLMPLAGENRILVRLGLEQMRRTANKGLRALFSVAGIEQAGVNAGHIGFQLAPRINASGRLDSADEAVRLLIAADDGEALRLARELDRLNRDRQLLVEEITQEASAMLESRMEESGLPHVIVLAREGWNVGVIGIVASRLLDRFYRPTIILGIDPENGMAKGSARSIPGFDIHRALSECHGLFTHYGGHQAAAGMSLPEENIGLLDRRLNELAEAWLQETDLVPLIRADLECALEEISVSAIEQLETMAPFGMGNPSPKFVFSGLRLEELKTIGRDGKHLKLALSNAADGNSCTVEAVGFGQGHLADWISSTATIDLLGELSVNEWNGRKKAQIVISDLSVPQVQLFDWRGCPDPAEKISAMLERVRSQARGEGHLQGIVVGPQHDPRRPDGPWFDESCPVWLLGGSGETEPLNEAACSSSAELLEDAVLYSLPANTSMLAAFIRRASGVKRWYAIFAEDSGEERFSLPSREAFRKVYAALYQAGTREIPRSRLIGGLSRRSGFSPAAIRFMIDVFEELTFIEREGNVYRMVRQPKKQDLSCSSTFCAKKEREQVETLFVYSSAQELLGWIKSQSNQSAMEGRS
jgi:single-stranded-DNA-specific exonuclease